MARPAVTRAPKPVDPPSLRRSSGTPQPTRRKSTTASASGGAPLGGCLLSGRRAGGAWLRAAQRRRDAVAFSDGEDAVDRGQLHIFFAARRPVNFGRARVGRVAQAEVRSRIVGRDVAAAAQYILPLAH